MLKGQLAAGKSKDPLIRFTQFMDGYRFDAETRTIVRTAGQVKIDKPVAEFVSDVKKAADKHVGNIITQVETSLSGSSVENEARVLASYKPVFGAEIDELIRKRSEDLALNYDQFRDQVYRFAKLNVGVVPKNIGAQFGQTSPDLNHLIERNLYKALSRSYEQKLQLCRTTDEARMLLELIEPELKGRSRTVATATMDELEKIINFCDDISSGRAKKPRLYQAIRAYEIVCRGTRRMVCADATASGKTYTALLIKQLLDRAHGKKRLLLVAPEQALLNAWPDEIQASFPEYRFLHIKSRHDMKNIGTADIVGVNYQKFGFCEAKENPYVRQLLRSAEDNEFGMIVFDEIQSIKNPSAKRTSALESILKIADSHSPHILGLSATMPHNTLKDLGVPLHILFPHDYPLRQYDLRSNPWAVKEAKISGRWRALSRDDLRRVIQLPELETYPTSPTDMESRDLESMLQEWNRDPVSKKCLVKLSEGACDEYFKIWADGDIHVYQKIHELRKILIQDKLPYVERLVKRILAEEPNAQIAIYSYLRKDITDKLASRLSTKGISANYIDGGKKWGERQAIANDFRNGTNRILVATTKTTGESISLCTGDKPIYALLLEPCFDPGDSSQLPGRFCRQQQTAPVKVLTLLAYNPELAQRMSEATSKLEVKYNVQFKATWRPSTIDVDLYEILNFKGKINRDFAQSDIVPSDIDELIGNFDLSRKAAVEESGELLIKSLPRHRQKPGVDLMNGYKASVSLYGKGSKVLLECDEGTNDKAASFDLLHKGYGDEALLKTLVGVNNRYVAEIIKSTGAEYISDWGCGTAPLARVIGRPIINLDLSRKMLESAREACIGEGLACGKVYDNIKGEKFPKLPKDGLEENYFVRSFMQDTPFARNSFDAISISFALHYNAQGGKENREIEDIVIEANRVLKPDGHLLLALTPTFTSKSDFEGTKKLLTDYKFNIVPEVTAFWKCSERGSKGAYYVLAQKAGIAKDYADDTPDIFVPSEYRATGGARYFRPLLDRSPRLFEYQPDFVNSDGRSLKEILEQRRNVK